MSELPLLQFDAVAEGEDVAPFVLENVNRTHFVKYAGASGDFNPMHHDDTMAQAVGYPSVFGHGMFSAGVLSGYVTRLIGGVANLRKFSTQFRGQIWPGDTVTFSAKITGKSTENGENRVDMDLAVTNQDGKAIVLGSATAALTS
ncbi:MAG: MaoC/PaaZ C-terminal domain-containing protein [Actinomycetota bacterium]